MFSLIKCNKTEPISLILGCKLYVRKMTKSLEFVLPCHFPESIQQIDYSIYGAFTLLSMQTNFPSYLL
jgi:hypothetical protein